MSGETSSSYSFLQSVTSNSPNFPSSGAENTGQSSSSPKTSILLQRAIRGDRDSLERVVAHLTPFVEAQVRFRLGGLSRNQADVEDLVSEVWAVVLRKLPELHPVEGHFEAVLSKYLSTTSSHLCNNFLRRHVRQKIKRRGTRDSSRDRVLEQLPQETRSILTRVFHAEIAVLIRSTLDRLSDDKRQLLVLRLLEHRSNQEIAEFLDIQANTVAVKYARALEELRRRLPKTVFQELSQFGDNSSNERG